MTADMMTRSPIGMLVLVLSAVALTADRGWCEPAGWPGWRGPNGNGIADPQQQPPTSWSERENVLWKVKIPGRGHGSATVHGGQVFLAAADSQSQQQLMLAFDRDTGKQNWRAVIHEGGFKISGKRPMNEKASLASSTAATDGERLYINFLNDNAIWTTALSLQGEIVWQRKITDYIVHQGYGSSPVVFEDLVIVSADNKGGGVIVALDRKTGSERWRRERPAKPNYASPTIVTAAGKQQLIFTGCDLVTSLDPRSGTQLWEIEGATTECVTTAVSDGKRVFTSGGYPRNHVSAVAADGSGKVIWENETRAYVPSMLQRDGFLFLTLDAGLATCLACEDGRLMWKARLGGTFSSSPVMVGDLIYASNEGGQTFVFKADPNQFQQVAENQLGESVFATPAICDGRIYTRVAHREEDRRQEYLYCLGQ